MPCDKPDFNHRQHDDNRPQYTAMLAERFNNQAGEKDACQDVVPAGDMEIIASPTDFLGVNLYSRMRVEPSADRGLGFRAARPTLPLLPMGYEAAPHSLGDYVRWVSKEYGRPRIYITENGVNDNAEPENGVIDDHVRMDLLRGFLAGLQGAIQDGADVRAYYLWSFCDNFEWAFGFSKRFGIVHTNFETLVRTPKKSAAMYSEIIRNNAVPAFWKARSSATRRVTSRVRSAANGPKSVTRTWEVWPLRGLRTSSSVPSGRLALAVVAGLAVSKASPDEVVELGGWRSREGSS